MKDSADTVVSEPVDRFKKYRSFVTSSSYFQRLCEEVFKSVDTDNSKAVDVKETYIAVLMLYLRLAPYIKGLTPPSEEVIRQLIQANDFKKSDSLDIDEFKDFATILFSTLSVRIAIQCLFVLILIPIVTNELLDFYCLKMPRLCKATDGYIPDGVGFTITTTILTLLAMPFILSFIDTLFIKDDKGKKI